MTFMRVGEGARLLHCPVQLGTLRRNAGTICLKEPREVAATCFMEFRALPLCLP